MTNGFAMIAWPAEYATSGVMTFMVDRSGRVLQKDLGEETASRIATMLVFDPDEGWGAGRAVGAAGTVTAAADFDSRARRG